MRRPAAVLGGGPSLPSDLKKLPEDCVLIAVNDHAFHFCKPDVLVHQDKLRNVFALQEVAKGFTGMIVSPHENSHVTLPPDALRGDFSSFLATWFALWSDYEPVILCGMDLYQGKVKYCHPRPGVDYIAWHAPLELHLKYWRMASKRFPHVERLRAMSGPLVEMFGVYEQLAFSDQRSAVSA